MPEAMIRPPPRTAFEFAERGWRIALAWLIGIPLGLFFLVLLGCLSVFLVRALVLGQSVGDVTGGLDRLLAALAPAYPYLAAAIGAVWGMFHYRSGDVRAQIRAGGGQGDPPFGQPPPPSLPGAPADHMVNPHGGPAAP
jgi:hypothetical protein